MDTKPLIVIVGPTASGKTALAVTIAKQYGGEIICADSRTVYRGMDIGTAKPTPEERSEVPHWGLDLVEPDQKFTVADFQKYAIAKIKDIRSRGKVPLLVGGTGLYVDAIVFDYRFGPAGNTSMRDRLEGLSLMELHAYCMRNAIPLPENRRNKRYVIRAIEQGNINNNRLNTPIKNCNIVGISTNKEILQRRITERAEHLFRQGVIEEAKRLSNSYGWHHESMTGNIYPLCRQYVDGELTYEELKERFRVLDWRLAKRQLTWFRRNAYIHWCDLEEAQVYIGALLESDH